ncbi:MAG: hypothetical protein ACRD3B_17270 [Candidatus Sulfotelmatobacter sp.]
MKSLRVCALVLCASTLFAADQGFQSVVTAIETTYGVRHMHIPLLGVALFFVRSDGVRCHKLAVFENFHGTDTADISRIVEDRLGPDWHPFVRVHSKGSNGETTLIYAKPSGHTMRLMIVSIEPSEATVVEVNIPDHSIAKWIKEPAEEAANQSHHNDHATD